MNELITELIFFEKSATCWYTKDSSHLAKLVRSEGRSSRPAVQQALIFGSTGFDLCTKQSAGSACGLFFTVDDAAGQQRRTVRRGRLDRLMALRQDLQRFPLVVR